MKKILIAMAVLVLACQPVSADPSGTAAGATKAIAKALAKRKKIEYFVGWTPKTYAYFEDIDYRYNGMMLADGIGDFMKNEPPRVIAEPNVKKGTLTEEVIYPVWSKLNRAHVLRNYILKSQLKVSKVNGKRVFYGIDHKQHRF